MSYESFNPNKSLIRPLVSSITASNCLLRCEISKSEKCVFELQENTNIVQPTLSQQLTVLRKSGLVKTRREGKQIYYSPSNPVAEAIIKILYKNFCD